METSCKYVQGLRLRAPFDIARTVEIFHTSVLIHELLHEQPEGVTFSQKPAEQEGQTGGTTLFKHIKVYDF